MTTASPPLTAAAAELEDAYRQLDISYRERVHDVVGSITRCREAMEVFTRHHDDDGVARTCNLLGLFYMIRCEFDQALDFSMRALRHFEKAGDRRGIADAKYNIGSVYYKSDNFHQGLDYLLQCLALYRELGDAHNEARVLKSMGTVYEYFGDIDNAIASYEGSIGVAQAIGDENAVSNAYNPLSGLYLKRTQPDKALELAEQSIGIKLRTGDRRGMGFSLYARGKVHIYNKRYAEAVTDLQESCRVHHDMGEALGEAMALNKLGYCQYLAGHYHQAKSYLQGALTLARQVNVRFVVYKAHYHLYLTARAAGRAEEALLELENYLREKDAVVNSHTFHVLKSYQSIQRIESLEQQSRSEQEKMNIIERKNAELDSFFYRVSHDLKGPISSMLGLYAVATMDVKDDHARKYFDLYHGQVNRINNIVMDLINLTRLNNAEQHRVRIDFNRLLDECIESYAYLTNYPAIEFIREVEAGIEFHGEWAVMNTILQNLIENSIKYARTHQRQAVVRITIQREDQQLRIVVADNGIGIALEHQPRIFDMFYRANEQATGTGLGLYILKRAVERLKGFVTFVSVPNTGTTFTITLPMS
ncbi:MAG: tetratricopeptide repeat-containing sensor histidine kinase [Cyclobacteriaceae bacterium]